MPLVRFRVSKAAENERHTEFDRSVTFPLPMFMCPAQTHVTTICHAFTTVDEDYINAYDCKLTFFSSATSTEAHLLFDAEKLSRHVLSKSYKPQINHFRDPYHRHALPRSQSPVVPPLDQSAVTEDDASVQLYSHDGTPFDFRLLMGHQLKQADRSVTRLTGVSASHVSEPSHWVSCFPLVLLLVLFLVFL